MSRVYKRLIVAGEPWTVERTVLNDRVRYTVGPERYTADDCRRPGYRTVAEARAVLVEYRDTIGREPGSKPILAEV